MSGATDLNSYLCSDKGIILPAINEYTWAVGVRAFFYLLALVWCFLGMAIVSDMFMCGIEKITSKTKIIRVSNPKAKDGYDELEVKVWNDTVANLSLMAFGTSAPEILLSSIEIITRGFRSGELGAATIVGSAAFNLLVITGICVACIPNGQVRKISNLRVYGVTSFFSIFAYVWLIIVLIVVSPGVVHLWEAIVTFLMFPVLITSAYIMDKCCRGRRNKTASEMEVGIDNTAAGSTGSADIIHIAKELGKHKIPPEEAAKIAAAKLAENQSHNSGWYRIQATRKITGGHRLVPKVNDMFKDLFNQIHVRNTDSSHGISGTPSVSLIDLSEGGNKAVMEFTAASCAILENEGKVSLNIRRYGRLNMPVSVRIETIDGTAEAGSDYIAIKRKITFGPNETCKDICIEIIDDDIWEPDEFFFAKLFIDQSDENADSVILGATSINQITIINDDEPGRFEFSKPSYIVKEGTGKAQLYVNRINGADGSATVTWNTKDMTAETGKDFLGGEGTLIFAHGEIQKTIDIILLDSDDPDRDCSFMVELQTSTEGASVGKVGRTIVTLVSDEEFNNIVSRIAMRTQANLDSLQLETASWSGQFKDAMNVNGGDTENATWPDYVLHFCSFFWKVLFAAIPPPSIGGGWLTFWLSLAMIALLTAIVGDLASIFGCLVGLSDLITAITFVALGTSMPDTFASKQAAIHEKYADSSVGNINGSNAVNVFLGLGLPWLISTIYWEVKGAEFEVSTGSLVFSVIMYLSCAVMAISLLLIRRRLSIFGKAELGGARGGKLVSACFLVLLWVLYVLISSLQAENIITVSF